MPIYNIVTPHLAESVSSEALLEIQIRPHLNFAKGTQDLCFNKPSREKFENHWSILYDHLNYLLKSMSKYPKHHWTDSNLGDRLKERWLGPWSGQTQAALQIQGTSDYIIFLYKAKIKIEPKI